MSQIKKKNSSEKLRNSSSVDEKHKNEDQKAEKKGKSTRNFGFSQIFLIKSERAAEFRDFGGLRV